MIGKKKLPIGVDDFEKLIRQEFYYADKTKMIAGMFNFDAKDYFQASEGSKEVPSVQF